MSHRKGSAEEYLYGSGRVKALERGLLTPGDWECLWEAESLERRWEILSELGVEIVKDAHTGAILREETLELRLKKAYEEVLSLTEENAFLKLWLYPYDCNHIKAFIKCRYRGIDPKGMLYAFGTVEPAVLEKIFANEAYRQLPHPFGEAAEEAVRRLNAFGDPREVDLLMDAACWQGMLELAEESGVEMAVRLVRQQIDLTNLLTCLRYLRGTHNASTERLPNKRYPEGGSLDHAFLTRLCEEGEARFWERLRYTPYEVWVRRAGNGGYSMAAADLAAQGCLMDAVREAQRIPYGPEPIMGYLLAFELEDKQLRILLSGLALGLPRREIWERIWRGDV